MVGVMTAFHFLLKTHIICYKMLFYPFFYKGEKLSELHIWIDWLFLNICLMHELKIPSSTLFFKFPEGKNNPFSKTQRLLVSYT